MSSPFSARTTSSWANATGEAPREIPDGDRSAPRALPGEAQRDVAAPVPRAEGGRLRDRGRDAGDRADPPRDASAGVRDRHVLHDVQSEADRYVPHPGVQVAHVRLGR